jgi:hypothetical protein
MKPGDIVICINKDKLGDDRPYFIRAEITIGKQYKALPYPPSITLEEWREQQLMKIIQ